MMNTFKNRNDLMINGLCSVTVGWIINLAAVLGGNFHPLLYVIGAIVFCMFGLINLFEAWVDCRDSTSITPVDKWVKRTEKASSHDMFATIGHPVPPPSQIRAEETLPTHQAHHSGCVCMDRQSRQARINGYPDRFDIGRSEDNNQIVD